MSDPAVLSFTIESLPGLQFAAVPLTSPPSAGSLVFLYGSNRLIAVAEYAGDDVWNVVHERFDGVEPTHWVVASGGVHD